MNYHLELIIVKLESYKLKVTQTQKVVKSLRNPKYYENLSERLGIPALIRRLSR